MQVHKGEKDPPFDGIALRQVDLLAELGAVELA